MSTLQAFLLGVMVAWTPALVIFAILLVRAPTLRKDEEVSNRRRSF